MFIPIVSKYLIRRYLNKWKKTTNCPALPESSKFIKRTYSYTDICVDLCWSIKKHEGEHSLKRIERRCSWKHVRQAVRTIEKHDLPRTLCNMKSAKKINDSNT